MPIESSSLKEESRRRRRLVLRMLGFLRPVWPTALVAALIVIGRIAIEIPTVYILSPAITTVAHGFGTSKATSFLGWLFGGDAMGARLRSLLLWMAVSQLALGAMVYLRAVWDSKLSMRAVYHIRAAIYNRLQHVGFAFHDRISSGQLINRAISDLQAVRNFVNTSLISTLDITVSIGAYLALLYFRSPWLMLGALLPLPFWWLVISRFNRKAQAIYQSQQQASDSVMSALTDNLSGVHVVRAFGLEKREIRKYSILNDSLLERLFGMVRLQARLTPTLKAIATGAHVLLFVVASTLVQKGRIQVGDLMILGLAMGTILSKLQQVNVIIEVYQRAVVSAERLFEVLDTPSADEPGASSEAQGLPAPQHPEPLQIRRGEIEFDQIHFGYDSRKLVLKKVSARIPAHRVTALVGPTGSGKTTFAGLIARFYDPQAGTIRIDGQDLKRVDLTKLRHHVGYVFQETFLFSDTIRNNIRYGRMDISEEMLRKAARAAHAEEFIEALPNGYDTLLGEGGVLLSGGQRQRLALARALVYDPEILILDDATAALDPRTEQSIHSMLAPLFESRTVLMIANRMSTVQHADHVLVMKDGEIVQSGTHSELVESEGHYQEILRMHLAHGVPEEAEAGAEAPELSELEETCSPQMVTT